jgi:hypothetical protein
MPFDYQHNDTGDINVPGLLLLLGASLAYGPKLSASLGDTDQKLTPLIIVLNVVARLIIMGGSKYFIQRNSF